MNANFYNFQLVEGTFSPADSADVLLSLIADKIKFHNLQILCLQDKKGFDMAHAQKRIGELKETKKEVSELILKARNSGYHLKIDGKINIELIKQALA